MILDYKLGGQCVSKYGSWEMEYLVIIEWMNEYASKSLLGFGKKKDNDK